MTTAKQIAIKMVIFIVGIKLKMAKKENEENEVNAGGNHIRRNLVLKVKISLKFHDSALLKNRT